MAKRAPAGELAYNPLDMTLAQSVVKGPGMTRDAKILSGEGVRDPAAANPAQAPQSRPNGNISEMPTDHSRIASLKATAMRSLNREKRVLLTPEEERDIERLVDRIGEQLGTSLKLSHLLRACMTLLCHAEGEIIRHTLNFHPLPRPANGDAIALAQFEQALAKLLSKSLRDAPAIR